MIVLLLFPIVAGLFVAGLLTSESAIEHAPTYIVCSGCSYNLTGLPPNRMRCPECGAELQAHPPYQRYSIHLNIERLFLGLALLLLAAAGCIFSLCAARMA